MPPPPPEGPRESQKSVSSNTSPSTTSPLSLRLPPRREENVSENKRALERFRQAMTSCGVPGDSGEHLEAFLSVLIRGCQEMEEQKYQLERAVMREKLDKEAAGHQFLLAQKKVQEAQDESYGLRKKLRKLKSQRTSTAECQALEARALEAEKRLHEFLVASEEGRYCLLGEKVAEMTKQMEMRNKQWEEKLEEKDEVIFHLQELLQKHKDFIEEEPSRS